MESLKFLREASKFGNGAHIILPKQCLGMRFEIIQTSETQNKGLEELKIKIMNNLSEREESIVSYLKKRTSRPNTIRRIGRELKINESNTSKLIQGLENKGLIYRRKIDGRTNEIRLTSQDL